MFHIKASQGEARPAAEHDEHENKTCQQHWRQCGMADSWDTATGHLQTTASLASNGYTLSRGVLSRAEQFLLNTASRGYF